MSVESRVLDRIEDLRYDLVSLLQGLVRIPSYPCTIDQNKCLNLIEDFLSHDKIHHDRWVPNWEQAEKVKSQNNNNLYTHNENFKETRDQIAVLVSEYGKGKRCITLNGHVDIAGVEPLGDWTCDPFSASIRGNKLYGRGAMDMKGGLVGLIGALRAIAEADVDINGRIQLQAVPEEETGGNGTVACISKGYIGDATVFAEPSNLKVLTQHTGIQEFKITIKGRAGAILWHNPGVDSIYPMGRVLTRLEELQAEREIEARKRVPGYSKNDNPGFINVGFLKAGEWIASDSTVARAKGLMSLLPGESPHEAIQALREAVEEEFEGSDWFTNNPPEITYQSIGHEGGGILPNDHPLVSSFVSASDKAGIQGGGVTHSPLMVSDAKITHGGGFSPSIVFGPKGYGLHSPDEYVELDSMIQMAKATALGVLNFLNEE